MGKFIHRAKGFTLIELVLILSIIGILSILTVPNLTGFNEHWILKSTAYMLANDIRRIQRLSVQECTQYNFELNTTQFYYLLRNNDPTKPIIKKVFLDPKITYISSTLQRPYQGMLDYYVLKFSYLGSPNQAGEIYLETINGKNISLTIDVTTGRVKVYD